MEKLANERLRPKAGLAYRADIDGLRGVAVLLVVLFHAGAWPVTGGFIGVDVFFVISGYLITSFVVSDLGAGQFSFADFFARRARRILPALLVVIAGSLVAGYFVMMPNDYSGLGWQAVYAALGVGNFYFLDHTGYFDAPADEAALLHTWSLGVEEQFYLVWPLVAALIFWRISQPHRFLRGVLVGVIVVTLILSIYGVYRGFPHAFYMPYARAWELAIGALIVFLPPLTGRWSRLLPALGLALIVSSGFILTRDTPAPGLAVLPACIGAAWIVWPGARGIGTSMLSSRPLVAVGLISYSLYLWHWPLLALARYSNAGELGLVQATALLALATVLAVGSYLFVERPFRRLRLAPRWMLPSGLAAAVAVAFLASAPATGSVAPSLRPDIKAIAAQSGRQNQNPRRDECFSQGGRWISPNSACTYGAADVRTALWGDSHALALAQGLERSLSARGEGFRFFGGSGCRPIVLAANENCAAYNREVLAFLLSEPGLTTVVLGARWTQIDESASALQSTIDALIAGGKSVVLVYPAPEPLFSVTRRAARLAFAGQDPSQMVIRRNSPAVKFAAAARLLDSIPERPGLTRAYPTDRLCVGDVCRLWVDGRSMYADDHHISLRASELVGPELIDAIDRVRGEEHR